MQPAEDRLEALAVVFDDADDTRQRRGFPRVEIIDETIRRHAPESFPASATSKSRSASNLPGDRIPAHAASRALRAGAAPPAKTRPAVLRWRAQSRGRCK